MIPFPFNENLFSFFFVADYLLVGQLCTNPKSDRSLLSCLEAKVRNASQKIVQCGYGIKETSRGTFQNKHVIVSPARECATTS